MLVWDNLNTHLAVGMRRYIADRDWLTAYLLPSYAPDLNPVEGTWSVLRRIALANRAFANPRELITAVRRGSTPTAIPRQGYPVSSKPRSMTVWARLLRANGAGGPFWSRFHPAGQSCS